ncbi:MAG TPA: sigma-54 dependent transcriptional regulator [Myxococcales bacterium]|nr:sigma-54 dependent transcriptional regulator [Myxococcales bacterium]
MESEATPAEAATILVVDDDRSNLESIERIFAKEGYRVRVADDGAAALEIVREDPPAVVVTDLAMPGLDGVALLKAIKAVDPQVEVVLMTAYGTVEGAVAAMKEGAYDFITKPLKRHSVLRSVRKALEKQALVQENRALRARLAGLSAPGGLVGQSPVFRATLDLVRQAAASHATVLLTGESGTGKELVARALHELSPVAEGPFVAVNCAAIPETILEAELFGFERGAFTGAIARKEGRFERAHHGTLFLDEVGEMSPAVQVKLLRVVQEGEIERLGGSGPIPVDVRLVAATNRDLKKEVAEGRFRSDLYYRLDVVAIALPPLRERPEDIPLLAAHFLRQYCQKNGKQREGFTPEAERALEGYGWPGNVRELENAIERAVVLSRGPLIDVEDLPNLSPPEGPSGGAAGPSGAAGLGGRTLTVPLGTPLEEIERRVIRETLRQTRGDKTLAAQLLGIATRTIYRKIDRDD